MEMGLKPLRRPDQARPFRWKPGSGEPVCLLEQMTQFLYPLVPYVVILNLVATVVLIFVDLSRGF